LTGGAMRESGKSAHLLSTLLVATLSQMNSTKSSRDVKNIESLLLSFLVQTSSLPSDPLSPIHFSCIHVPFRFRRTWQAMTLCWRKCGGEKGILLEPTFDAGDATPIFGPQLK